MRMTFIIILISASQFLCRNLTALTINSWMDIWHTTGPLTGTLKTDYMQLDESQKALFLDKLWGEIEYCLKNFNKDIQLLDRDKTGRLLAPKITNAIIADKLWQYRDYARASDFYYKDWLDLKKNRKSWEQSAMGDEHPLLLAIAALEQIQEYSKSLKYHSEYYRYEIKNRYGAFSNTALIKSDFEKYKVAWPSLAQQYQEMMENWSRAKRLAKTSRPKPLDPAVQHHEWFYSDKQEEVLKALEYYHKHDVRFMLEKALKHKDSVIAAKAKEYLDSPVKDKEAAGHETKK